MLNAQNLCQRVDIETSFSWHQLSREYVTLNPILLGGGQFCPTPKIYSNTLSGKVTQKCYQICVRNLFS